MFKTSKLLLLINTFCFRIETRLEKTKNTDEMLNKTENINDIVGENHVTKKYIESVYSEIISYLNSTNSTKIPNINYDDINEKIRSFHYKIHRVIKIIH